MKKKKKKSGNKGKKPDLLSTYDPHHLSIGGSGWEQGGGRWYNRN